MTMNGRGVVGDPVDGDVALLHDFEQRRLRLRRRAVDLVGQHDVVEDRTGVELERAPVLVVHRHAGRVGRQQVGRELDPRVRPLDRVGQRPRQHRLAGAGQVLEQQVPSDSRQVSVSRITWSLPSTARPMDSAIVPNAAWKRVA